MKDIKIYVMLLGFSVFTGATFQLAKYTVDYLSPSSAAAWRFGAAALIMVIILLTTEGIKKEILKTNLLWYIILGIVGIFGFNGLFFAGLKYTSPVNGALIMGLNPLLTTIIARIIMKEAISKKQAIGILFAFFGVLLVITHGSFEIIKNLSVSVGDCLILGGNICWALYGVLARRFIKGGTPISTTSYTMIIGAFALIIVSVFSSKPVSIQDIPMQAWGALLFMAVFTSVLGYLWWNKGMKELGSNKTAIFFNIVPVVAMIISVMGGTPITLLEMIGAVCVIIGVFLSTGVIRISFAEVTKGSTAIRNRKVKVMKR
ncbi:EamA family transporter [Bacillus sp. FJAT-49736]|uniref:DMT family transporter n=1 Tax=Bacillus sp. FJAT-49736 TaxID=2833582 RepID=UPI001BCA0D7F|nr:EamA family transporter [Bacillus sp. FJAT-49736]MBS4172795.1 EamA family transporter [Bacillus sp. FJAT-49736]